MKYYILGSGSKGNAALFESQGTMILIDFGFSLKEFRARLNVFSLDEKDITATLITHKHTDHLNPGFKTITKDNVYATKETINNGLFFHEIVPYTPFYINNFKITPLQTSHDAPNPVGFVLETNEHKVVYMTDTGYISSRNLDYMKNADLYVVEANHNERMLLQTNRPFELIQRILVDTGHLSNETTAHYLAELVGEKTKHIVLAHLSEEANTPALALESVRKVFEKYRIDQNKLLIKAAGQHIPLSGDLNEN